MNTLKTANLYSESPIAIFSAPNFIAKLRLATVTPNDYYFPEQWALNKIRAAQGWDISTGSSDIIIAVLDTGVDLTHEDLQNKLVDGYDFYARPRDEDPSPYQGDDPRDAHGTACAGLAAAETNNQIGVTGVAWGSRIMPLKIGISDELVASAAATLC